VNQSLLNHVNKCKVISLRTKEEKLIITVAPSGADTLPTQTPHLPITPDEIAEEIFKCYQAGASIAHVHARESETGKPTPNLSVYREICEKVKKKCDIVICVTTGGAVGLSPQERLAVLPELQPEMCSFTPESVNVGLFKIADRYQWKFAWEKPFLEDSKNQVFSNSFADLETFTKTMKKYGTKPECEFFSTSGIYNLNFLVHQGLIDKPIHCQFVLGTLGGTGAYPIELMHFYNELVHMYGKDNFTWSTIGVGYPGMNRMAAMAIMMGGHVRVGMEDNIYIRGRKHAKSNVDFVKDIRALADILGREIATPQDARLILRLKGADKTNF